MTRLYFELFGREFSLPRSLVLAYGLLLLPAAGYQFYLVGTTMDEMFSTGSWLLIIALMAIAFELTFISSRRLCSGLLTTIYLWAIAVVSIYLLAHGRVADVGVALFVACHGAFGLLADWSTVPSTPRSLNSQRKPCLALDAARSSSKPLSEGLYFRQKSSLHASEPT